jgi:hypothetical protein
MPIHRDLDGDGGYLQGSHVFGPALVFLLIQVVPGTQRVAGHLFLFALQVNP